MTHLIFLAAVLLLLAGFLALTRYEAHRGARLFSVRREALDASVERLQFIFTHIDFAAFIREEVNIAAHRASHAVAHLSLRVVRAVERLLTRIVRHLRAKHAATTAIPRGNAREFVKTLADFKDTLKEVRAEVSEI